VNSPSIPLNEAWQDKRWWWLLSPAIPLAFTAPCWPSSGQAQWWCMLLAPLVIHVLLPMLDRVLGEDFSNPPESAVAQLDADVFYRAMVWAYVPLQMIGTVLGAWIAALSHCLGWAMPPWS
jgi:alkane 1-monooxygenase